MTVRVQKPPPRTSSIDSTKTKAEEQCYVKNSSFLSRDIQAQKTKVEPVNNVKAISESAVAKETTALPEGGSNSPPRKSILSPPKIKNIPPKNDVMSPTKTEITSPPKSQVASPPKKETSPPGAALKIKRNDDSGPPKSIMKETGIIKEVPIKTEKLSISDNGGSIDHEINKNNDANNVGEASGDAAAASSEESNGVGDKIKKFERAAEDAAPAGRLSRPGSVRGRARPERPERRGSDPKEDLPPPATPFKDNVHFELGTVVRQQSVSRSSPPKWPRAETQPAEDKIKKPEPQKIIKPEFKPMSSPVDVTIRSPSLGAKIPDQFPSHGTAFRNVASPSPDAARAALKPNEDLNAANHLKVCKAKPKEKYSVSKGSSYFTRGSEEIWLVKKKDIEEIEERVLDSFRRAGGNVCVRSESLRPASDGGHAHAHAHGHAHGAPAFAHATMGRKRQMYARSESLDPQWAGARAQTLKRQTSVACTCGHDKKTRARSAGAPAEPAPRPRSRSHGDDHASAQVLDKYETLV